MNERYWYVIWIILGLVGISYVIIDNIIQTNHINKNCEFYYSNPIDAQFVEQNVEPGYVKCCKYIYVEHIEQKQCEIFKEVEQK